MKILLFLIALLAAWPAAAQTKCVVLSSDGTTIVGGPMPPSAVNDCSQYTGATAMSVTDPRWSAYQTSLSAAQAAGNYQATLAQYLNAGVAITCTCTGYAYGSLNGTYALTDAFVTQITNLSLRAVGSRKLSGNHGPNGGATIPLYDTAGVTHYWDSTHILELNDVITDYKFSMTLQNVQVNGWPSTNAFTIN